MGFMSSASGMALWYGLAGLVAGFMAIWVTQGSLLLCLLAGACAYLVVASIVWLTATCVNYVEEAIVTSFNKGKEDD